MSAKIYDALLTTLIDDFHRVDNGRICDRFECNHNLILWRRLNITKRSSECPQGERQEAGGLVACRQVA